jgi:hypothetical protein
VVKSPRSARGQSDQSGPSNVPSCSQKPKPRVRTSRRSLLPAEVVMSDDPPSNGDHPLGGLSRSERRCQRLLKLAQIVAETAKRQAIEQTSNEKEESHD